MCQILYLCNFADDYSGRVLYVSLKQWRWELYYGANYECDNICIFWSRVVIPKGTVFILGSFHGFVKGRVINALFTGSSV